MKLTDSLKKEFIASLNRLSESIRSVSESNYFDYYKLEEIHRTYIDYCKAFKSVDEFSECPINLNIKLPKLLFKLNFSGNADIKDVLLLGRFARRNTRFENESKSMLEDINVNLKLMDFYLKENPQNQNDEYLCRLKNTISNQPVVYRKKRTTKNIVKAIIYTVSVIAIFFVLILRTDFKFLFKNTEVGHAFSYLFNLNDFKIARWGDKKELCTITWNGNIIYSKGKFNRSNINKSRYVYGDNYFTVKVGDESKEFYFYKQNNWDYHKFKFDILSINLWIDGELQ